MSQGLWLDTMLQEQRQHHTRVINQQVHPGANLRAMTEHLARASVYEAVAGSMMFMRLPDLHTHV